MAAYDNIDFKPSNGMVEEAKRGLEWRKEYGRGGTGVGVARARDIANRANLSPDTVRRMHSFFSRHEVNKRAEGFSPGEDGFPSAGRIAWALWGGDAGQTWAKDKVQQMENADKADKSLQLSQAEARYLPTSIRIQKCGGCVHYTKGACDRVQAEPLPIRETGWCNQWAKKPDAVKYTMATPDVTDIEDTELYQSVYERVLADTGDVMKAKLAARGMVTRRRMGLAVKSTKSGVVVAGWAIMYGDPLVKDLDQTYFANRDTNLFLDYYGVGMPLFYEHCQDRAYGTDPIGERTAQQAYEHGLWLEHTLYDDHRLYERTAQEVEDGVLAYSTDSIAHVVSKGYNVVDGALLGWPLVACSLVKNPAEPGLGQVVRKLDG